MSRWFRHYAGMMRDAKLVAVAVKTKQPVERVLWVWGAILESAAEINDGGRFELDCGEAAYFLRCDESELANVVGTLEAMGRLNDGYVSNWSERQYESDNSTERVRRHRANAGNRPAAVSTEVSNPQRNDDETLHAVSVTPPETETETDTDTDTDTKVSNPPNPPDEISQAFDEYNLTASELGLPKAQVLTPSRRSALSKRLKDCGGIEGWRFALTKIRGSPFCRGEKTAWKADLDFMLQAKSFTRLMEGSYDGPNNPAKSSLAEKLQRNVLAAEEFARRNVPGSGADNGEDIGRIPTGR